MLRKLCDCLYRNNAPSKNRKVLREYDTHEKIKGPFGFVESADKAELARLVVCGGPATLYLIAVALSVDRIIPLCRFPRQFETERLDDQEFSNVRDRIVLAPHQTAAAQFIQSLGVKDEYLPWRHATKFGGKSLVIHMADCERCSGWQAPYGSARSPRKRASTSESCHSRRPHFPHRHISRALWTRFILFPRLVFLSICYRLTPAA